VFGPAHVRQVWQLYAFLEGVVSHATSAAATEGEYVYREDGGADIILPYRSNERAEALTALHEIGHYVCERRPVGILDALPDGKGLSEMESEAFGDAFLLPPEVMRAIRCNGDAIDLMDDYGIPMHRIERRRNTLRQFGEPRITEPPAWCAWRHYRVDYVRHPLSSRFHLAPLSRHVEPLEIPVAPRQRLTMGRELHWDLLCLRPHEFLLKHRPSAVPVIEPGGLHYEELIPPARRRAARGRR
jgi:hypothetical protein